MIRIREVKVPITNDNKDFILKKVSKILRTEIDNYKINKKSIDARDKNNIMYIYELLVSSQKEDKILKTNIRNVTKYLEEEYKFEITNKKKLDQRPIIVGSGPAGLLCAYMLAENGYNPIILERGEKIEDRIKTVEEFFNTNKLN